MTQSRLSHQETHTKQPTTAGIATTAKPSTTKGKTASYGPHDRGRLKLRTETRYAKSRPAQNVTAAGECPTHASLDPPARRAKSIRPYEANIKSWLKVVPPQVRIHNIPLRRNYSITYLTYRKTTY